MYLQNGIFPYVEIWEHYLLTYELFDAYECCLIFSGHPNFVSFFRIFLGFEVCTDKFGMKGDILVAMLNNSCKSLRVVRALRISIALTLSSGSGCTSCASFNGPMKVILFVLISHLSLLKTRSCSLTTCIRSRRFSSCSSAVALNTATSSAIRTVPLHSLKSDTSFSGRCLG